MDYGQSTSCDSALGSYGRQAMLSKQLSLQNNSLSLFVTLCHILAHASADMVVEPMQAILGKQLCAERSYPQSIEGRIFCRLPFFGHAAVLYSRMSCMKDCTEKACLYKDAVVDGNDCMVGCHG